MRVITPGSTFQAVFESANINTEIVPVNTTSDELCTLIDHNGDIYYDCIVVSERQFLSFPKALRTLRQITCLPIVCFSFDEFSSQKKVEMLKLGVDDIVFDAINNPEELVASVTMRCSRSLSSVKKRITFVFSGHTLEIAGRESAVLVNEERITLTFFEFRVLYLLASRPGVLMTSQYMARATHLDDEIKDSNCLQVCICRIRKKLSEAGLDGKGIITTTRGIGYCFNTE